MMKLTIVLGAALATAGTASAAPAPAWCKDHAFSSPDLSYLKESRSELVVEAIANALCVPDAEVETNRAAIEASRQQWGKRLGMKDADWADVVAYAKNRSTDAKLSTNDLAAFTPIDQYIAITEGFERPNGAGAMRDPIYIADMFDANLAEVGRFAYALRCFGEHPADWAICQPDVEKLDAAKMFAEISADQAHDGVYKMTLRWQVFDLKAKLEKHQADVAAAWKSDAAYKKMFEVAAKARDEWKTLLGSEAELLGLLRQIESAHFAQSRSQFAGCEAKTTAALAEQVGKLPAKTFAKMMDKRWDPDKGFAFEAGPALVDNPRVSLAAIAYALCNHDGTSDFLAAYLQQTPGYRGPRSLGHTRLLTEKIQLDKVDGRIDWPDLDRPYRRSGGAVLSAGGVVASVTPDGKTVKVKLEKLIVKREECIASHYTKRIYKVHPDGRVEYEQVCDKLGVVTHDEQWMDFTVNAKYAPLLKKGVKFSALYAPQEERDAGMEVLATWTSGKADAPNMVLGAKLK